MLKLAPRIALLYACALTLLPGAADARARDTRPVLVELFTSQGCSACAAAEALAADLADQKAAMVLTFPVDYWDYLGWKDTFARPEFAERQRAYQKTLGLREVYTPQMVFDGAAQTGKTTPSKAPEMIRAAARAHHPSPAMAIDHGRLAIGSGPAPTAGADVWLVRYESRPRETTVGDGENRGATVVYRNVVKTLKRVGVWTGRAHVYPLPGAAGDLNTVILLQAKTSGHILGLLKP
jgi:hypothetical protein